MAMADDEGDRAMLAGHSKSSEAMLMRALVMFLTTDLGGAVAQVQEVLKLDPDNAKARVARARFRSVMESKQEGNTHFKSGDSAGAAEKWTDALGVSYDYISQLGTMLTWYTRAGCCGERRGGRWRSHPRDTASEQVESKVEGMSLSTIHAQTSRHETRRLAWTAP